jgi:uncharacterized membrane protein (UPF0127 family)
MGKATKTITLLIVVIIFFVFLVFLYQSLFWSFFVRDGQLVNLVLKDNFLSSTGQNLLVEVVKDDKSIQKGLSNRDQLLSKSGQHIDGMLFIFPLAETRYFWMKEMKFDIDICWLNKHALLACSRRALKPNFEQDQNQLPVYQSPQPADMVLETNPGFFEEEAIGLRLYVTLF